MQGKTKKCEECGGWDKCRNPYLDVVGHGGKGIMFIFPAPTISEDKAGQMMVDESQRFLMTTLGEMGIDFDRDCWAVNAVQCYTGPEIETLSINCCRDFLFEIINELQPRVVIPLGENALHALIGQRTTSRISLSPFDKWVGYIAPDQKLGINVAPLYHPDEVVEKLRTKKRASQTYGKYRRFDGELWENPQLTDWCDPFKVIHRVFKRMLQKAVKVKPVKIHGYEAECNYMGLESAKSFLLDIFTHKKTIAFDYETTGIKPHRKEQEILCIGISTGDKSGAFPIYEDEEFRALLKAVLTDPLVKKIGHNMKFEETWTRVIFGYKVQGWIWDCMLVAHIVDNRKGVTGLKFQGYNYFGVLGYDDGVEQFMKPTKEEKKRWGANSLNRLKEVDIDELCTYCAIDAHLTFKLYMYQKAHKPQGGDFANAFRLMHRGTMELVDVEQNGIMVNIEQVMTNELEIEEKLFVLNNEISECDEVKKWNLEEEFNFGSPKQLKHLLFKVLKYTPVKMTKKGIDLYGGTAAVQKGYESTDADVLDKLNTELTQLILQYKKLYKIKNTYLAGIKRETIDGIIHPSFNLNTVSSFRSSSSDPNFQNFSKHDEIANHYVKGVFTPRPGRQFIEYDYGQLEVRGATSISHDSSLITYTSDDSTDMHRDAAAMLFLKEPEDITKVERFYAKNKWVFAQFYGDWYRSCALSLWEAISIETKRHLRRHKVKDEKGDWIPIRNLAAFTLHCKEVERQFWEEMFPGYNKWRNDNWRSYVDTGIITWPTGFVSNNVFRRNQVNNFPVQGGSFHLTLGALILINQKLKKEGFKSLCIGQIHDSIVFDAVLAEIKRLSPMVGKIMMRDIVHLNPWIIVPLKVEADFYTIDGDWATLDHSEEVV